MQIIPVVVTPFEMKKTTEMKLLTLASTGPFLQCLIGVGMVRVGVCVLD